MSDIYSRGFVSLRRWQSSQASIRWATDAEVKAEFGEEVPEANGKNNQAKGEAKANDLPAHDERQGSLF